MSPLLDLGLPDMDGVEIIRKIRSWSNMPIIVISARTEDSDKIVALDAGADDYVLRRKIPVFMGFQRCCDQIAHRRIIFYNEDEWLIHLGSPH